MNTENKSDFDTMAEDLARAEKRNAPPPTSGNRQADTESRAGMGVGVSMASSIMVCAFLGVAVDEWFSSAPWGLIGFLMLGIASGFYTVYKASK